MRWERESQRREEGQGKERGSREEWAVCGT